MLRSSLGRLSFRIDLPRTLGFVLLFCAAIHPLAAQPGSFGPAVPGSWRTLGPDGATIRSIAVHPTDPSRVYAAGSGGVYRSRDGGESWTPIDRGLSLRPNLSTAFVGLSLAFDPLHPSTIYAAMQADGVAKSTDGGDSWTHVDSGIQTNFVSALALDPTRGDRIFAATYNGIYRTGDGGATWRRLTRGLPTGSPARTENVVLDPSSPLTVYAVFQEGNSESRRVYKSSNGGATWRSISSGPLVGRFVVSLAVDPHQPQVVYAGCRPGLFKSTDGGLTWRASGLESYGIFSLALHPTLPGTIYAGTLSSVFRSSNGGSHWDLVGTGLPNNLVYSLAFSPATPRTLFAGTSLGGLRAENQGGVFKTTNAAASWSFKSRGIKGVSADRFAIDPTTPATFWLQTELGLLKSLDRGTTWSPVDYSKGCLPYNLLSFDFDPQVPDTVYLASAGSGSYAVCVTHDGGATWRSLFTSADPILRIRVDPHAPATLYAAGLGGISRSLDHGGTWTVATGAVTGAQIYDLLPSPASPDAIYAYGTKPHPFTQYDLLRSTDHGSTWQNQGTPAASGVFDSLALDPADAEILYVAERGTIRRSRDGGASWSPISDAFFPRHGYLSASGESSGQLFFASQGDSVYESLDGGSSWSPLGAGPDQVVFTFSPVEDPQDSDRLYVGARSGGLLLFTRTP